MDRAPYVPLWVKTNHSFLEGASHPEELVDRAHQLALPAIAITDRDGVYGVVKAHVRGKELASAGGDGQAERSHGAQRVIVGAQVTVLDRDAPRDAIATSGTLPGTRRVVLLAQSREGYARIAQLLSKGHARAEAKNLARVTWDELCEIGDGVIALAPDARSLERIADAFEGRAYAMLTRHLEAPDRDLERALREVARRRAIPTVAAIEVLYHTRARQPLQDVLTCIRHGVTLTTAGRHLRANAEHELPTPAQMRALFEDDLASVDRTLEVAARCTFEMSAIRYVYPAERLPAGETQQGWLRALTLDGARRRYPMGVPDDAMTQIEKELALIEDLDYGGYFLTMWDVVRFCREKGILCQGRGSAANSIVCFCLGITAIDPVRMDLLFERFLSKERAEPPDIDVDIEHERREEVIQYVYERWGRRHAAMVANLIRYRARSALRDVGKALDLPQLVLDRAAKTLDVYAVSIDEQAMKNAGLDLEIPSVRHLLALVRQIQDFPRHLGIHPGGFLLGSEPVDTLCPIEPATMEGRTVVQWDKQDVEDLGLFKVDLLGLGALTVVHRAFDLLRDHDEIDLEIATVPAEDPTTFQMVSRGDTVGVFQIESRAQMAMLPRLRPRTFYDLVIEVAIVRPGPIQGDMVHPYLRRRAGLEQVTYPHPKLERVLSKTLGVPIFQEQVMKLAIECAGYSGGEADRLRRDMAAWRSKGRIEAHRERLITRMVADGIPQDFAERVFHQIKGFGEYGFPESHAASFALIAYVTAWLKCHHPAVFACSMLNAWPMGFYHPSTIVEDAKRHGVRVLPIDVRRSKWDCTLEHVTGEPRWALRMGLRYVRGFGSREKAAFERAWASEVAMDDLASFVRTVRLSRRAHEALAEAGALAGYGLDRRKAIWEVRALATEHEGDLPVMDAPSAKKGAKFRALAPGESISWDYRASMHSTRGHPMERLREALSARDIPDARTVASMRDGARVRYAGIVICRQRPGTATGVTFMTLEDETGFANVVIWRDVFQRFDVVGKTASLLEVEGRIQSADGVVHVIAEVLRDLGKDERMLRSAEEVPRSRDFH
ncbi:error-prone DNA polymerase [Sandaracinus amylolyticus]|uniref:error-prone DNA polymerase n=1 Tax=Sandaracinus amylolyticus TaxID=927083 RepID=UPI00069DEBF0|nr:error-prone DNA polymerase [Sandaracinus amylolyticus]